MNKVGHCVAEAGVEDDAAVGGEEAAGPVVAGEVAGGARPLGVEADLAKSAEIAGEDALFEGEAGALDDEIEADEGGFFGGAVGGDHALQFAVIEGGWLFEVDGDAALDAGAVHFGVQGNGCGNHEQVELVSAGIEHGAVIGEDLDAAAGKLVGGLLSDESIGLRVAGADEAGVALGLEFKDAVVVGAGITAEADDADADGGAHADKKGLRRRCIVRVGKG